MSSTQETPDGQPLRYPRSLVDHAHYSKHNTNLLQQNRLTGDTYRQTLPLPDRLAGDTYRQTLSALVFTTTATIAWRDFPCRQAPHALGFTKLQNSPGAPLLTARRYTSTCAVLVLVQVQAHFTQVALSCSHLLSF